MRETTPYSFVLIGGQGSGKSVIGNVLAGSPVFPVTGRTYGSFGCVVRRGKAHPRATWIFGKNGYVGMGPTGRMNFDRKTSSNIIWIERAGLPPNTHHGRRIVELSTAAFERRRDSNWYKKWSNLAKREIKLTNVVIIVVSPRGLGRTDVSQLIDMLDELPCLQDKTVYAWLNCYNDTTKKEVQPLVDRTHQILELILPVLDVLTLWPYSFYRKLGSSPRRFSEVSELLTRMHTSTR